MSALVRIEADRVVADSRDVASDFGKRHDHVLRSIDAMLKTQSDLAPNFGAEVYPVVTGDGGKRHARRFDMDRKGFMLLVMGFSGAKALEIKSRWIDAFDAMERMLIEGRSAANDDLGVERALLPPLGDMCRMAAVAETYRRLYGVEGARWFAALVGLPVPPLGGAVAALAAPARWLGSNVSEWVQDCCTTDGDARVEAASLYAAYQIWCAENGRVPETQTAFGIALSRLGFEGVKSRSGRIIRPGLRPLA